MVPSSIDVPASVNRGVAIILDEPKHAVSVAMRQLVDQYVRRAPDTAPQRESRSAFRALSRGNRR